MDKRIEQEKRTVERMIRIYCANKEGNKELCDSCKGLIAYSHARLDRCRFGSEKPSCRKCPVHCYRPDMKQKMKEVMRYSGPRMMLYDPVAAIRHILVEFLKI